MPYMPPEKLREMLTQALEENARLRAENAMLHAGLDAEAEAEMFLELADMPASLDIPPDRVFIASMEIH